jgi:hypothetical protein
MPKEKKESVKVTEVSAPVQSITPLYANLASVVGHPDIVMIDLGFLAPSYRKPYGLEDTQVARFCLDWDTARELYKNLKETISDHDQNLKLKKNNKEQP